MQIIWKGLSRPDKLLTALQKLDQKNSEIINKLFTVLINASSVLSSEILQGHNYDNTPIKFLQTLQHALFAQAMNSGPNDTWNLIIRDYTIYFLDSCLSILNSATFLYDSQIQEKTSSNLTNTILGNLFLSLLDSLIDSP